MDWIPNQKVQDLKHLLGDYTNTEEGMAVLPEWKKLMVYEGALYQCHTPVGKLGEVLQVVDPTAHHAADMNWCHWDAGHQGQEQTLYLLQDWFWCAWLHRCRRQSATVTDASQHESSHAKAAMQPIISTTKLDQPLKVVSILVFCDHFMKNIIAYMTPNQTGGPWTLPQTDFSSLLLQSALPIVWSCELRGQGALPPP